MYFTMNLKKTSLINSSGVEKNEFSVSFVYYIQLPIFYNSTYDFIKNLVIQYTLIRRNINTLNIFFVKGHLKKMLKYLVVF